MKIPNPFSLLLAGAITLATGFTAHATLVTITNAEVWDGTSTPHAADGVSVSGSGTRLDPAVYTIPPEGMLITSTGSIIMSTNLNRDIASPDATIRFQFQGGNLTMQAGAVIDTQRPMRGGEPWGPAARQDFILDLAAGDILGSGTIKGLRSAGGAYNSRHLIIINTRNVNFAAVDLHCDNINSQHATVEIEASGVVNVAGKVDASDKEGAGGSSGGNVSIKAEAITVGGVDVTTLRVDGNANPGSITLQALSAAGAYQTTSLNDFTNRLTLNGPVNTLSPAGGGGNITLQSVALQLSGGATVTKQLAGTLTVNVGDTNSPAPTPASLLFVNISGDTLTPTFDVVWNGTVPAGNAPSFTSHPINAPPAAPGVLYTFNLTATDPDGGTLTYSKGNGPAWLSVAANGVASGTPTAGDSGSNVFRVSVTDGTRFDITTLNVKVGGPPKFNTNLIVKPKAVANSAYTGQTLAGTATDADGDPITFARVSGPAWLNVAADGTLSGTPALANEFLNTWIVSVTDGTGTNTASLQILVGGPPVWSAATITKPNGAAGVDYATGVQTLASSASDPDGDTLTFSKISGPAWLTVATDGSLGGTPLVGDIGTNTWTVRVADGSGNADATLKIIIVAGGQPVLVSSTEVWDGVANPHAGEGVTLVVGNNTDGNPSVYTIPRGLHITSTGKIVMTPAGNPSLQAITFVMEGDLLIDAGGVINSEFFGNRDPFRHFIIDLNATNSITGAGQIGPITDNSSVPRVLTIQNGVNVSLGFIDAHIQNQGTSGRHINITVSGTVNIPGKLDNSDQDAGGGNAPDVTVKASVIKVGAIDTRAFRTGSSASNGRVFLYALSPDGNYDLNAGANNMQSNKVAVSGSINTKGVWDAGGGVTIQGVIVQFSPGFSLQQPTSAALALDAGVVQNGATANDLFINYVGSALTPAFDVQWSGTFVAPSAPTFTTKPITRPGATAGAVYSATLAGSATGGSGTLVYGKSSGPTWLQIASSGALSGTPGNLNVGSNGWTVFVTDGGLYDFTTLSIQVAPGNAPVIVNSVEDWDGVANPHAAEGVVLTPGNGSRTNPAVYTLPTGLTLSPGGQIRLDPPLASGGAHSNSIVFFFQGGHLQMDAGTSINTADHNRQHASDWPLPLFIIRGNGSNNISGAGNLIGLQTSTDTPRLLTISNMNNVTISNVDLHTENVNNGSRAINIRANGQLNLLNVDGTDRDTGGSSTGNVNLFGSSVTVSNISTENWRPTGGNNGNVNVRALSPAGGYDRTATASNRYPTNKVTANGMISTWKPGTGSKGTGLITIQGVIAELAASFGKLQPATNSFGTNQATFTVDAGVLAPGLTQANMFINNSAVTSGPTDFFLFDTFWSTTLQAVSAGAAGVTMSWSDVGTRLQRTTDLNNPGSWANVPGGTVSPITIPRTNPAAFFRLAY